MSLLENNYYICIQKMKRIGTFSQRYNFEGVLTCASPRIYVSKG